MLCRSPQVRTSLSSVLTEQGKKFSRGVGTSKAYGWDPTKMGSQQVGIQEGLVLSSLRARLVRSSARRTLMRVIFFQTLVRKQHFFTQFLTLSEDLLFSQQFSSNTNTTRSYHIVLSNMERMLEVPRNGILTMWESMKSRRASVIFRTPDFPPNNYVGPSRYH